MEVTESEGQGPRANKTAVNSHGTGDVRTRDEMGAAESRPPQLEKLFEGDGYLRTHESDILFRWRKFHGMEQQLIEKEGGLNKFAEGYKDYGIVQKENGDVQVCEWVPNGESVAVVGDFNNWNETSHVCTRDDFSKFRLTIPAVDGRSPIPHNSQVRTTTCSMLQPYDPILNAEYSAADGTGMIIVHTLWSEGVVEPIRLERNFAMHTLLSSLVYTPSSGLRNVKKVQTLKQLLLSRYYIIA